MNSLSSETHREVMIERHLTDNMMCNGYYVIGKIWNIFAGNHECKIVSLRPLKRPNECHIIRIANIVLQIGDIIRYVE